MKNIFCRQGDLLFMKVDEATETKPVKSLRIAEGEITGHNHVLIGKAKLVHPEHGEITFPAGNYQVILEREFDYIENNLKVVRD
jgi:hypothetical protein